MQSEKVNGLGPQFQKTEESGGAQLQPGVLDRVNLTVEACLGSAELTIGELSDLSADSVITLETALNETVSLRLNGVEFARGELIAVGDKFGIRITKITE